MHMDPFIHSFTGVILAIIILGITLKYLRIPYVMAYLISGIIIGPSCLKVITEPKVMLELEYIGVILLLFFVGMKVSVPKLIEEWKIEIIGTFFQISASVFLVAIVGLWFGWNIAQVFLLGFVISISSTAVVLKILEDRNEMDSKIGRDVIGILLVQDLALIPMIIVIELLGGKDPVFKDIALQIIGGVGIFSLLIWLARSKKQIKLPLTGLIKKNHELQVFAALLICFGLSFISELFNLAGPIGAFVAGIIVANSKETDWVTKSLQPFYIVFVALFFVSVGMLIDLEFVYKNWLPISLLVFLTLVTNTFINAFIFKILGVNWKEGLYGGGLLSQIGEFSFVLIAVGIEAKIIGKFEYQMAMCTIAFSLLISPLWINAVKWLSSYFIERDKST